MSHIMYSIVFSNEDGDYNINEVLSYDLYYNSTPIIAPQAPNVTIYAQDGTLFIQSSQQEEVSVYSITGNKLYTASKDAGILSLPASSFPQSILIIKGNDWARKIINSCK